MHLLAANSLSAFLIGGVGEGESSSEVFHVDETTLIFCLVYQPGAYLVMCLGSECLGYGYMLFPSQRALLSYVSSLANTKGYFRCWGKIPASVRGKGKGGKSHR